MPKRRRSTRTPLARLISIISFEAVEHLSVGEDRELRKLVALLRDREINTVDELKANMLSQDLKDPYEAPKTVPS